jgi:ABC-type amino acid transport substrate-binding protein
MDIQVSLMQKNGLVAMKLAQEFMTMQVGHRIPTIDEYSKSYTTARGTVQSALKLLHQHQAIALEAKGHLGTFISYMNYDVLWEFTGVGTLMGVMPLPYSKRYEGMASGLYHVIQEKNIPFSMAYMRGAQTRLKALEEGRYDLAVVSKLAALTAIKQGKDIEIAIEFGAKTYVDEHVVVFADPTKKSIEDNMKVGVDKSSTDHYLLTISQCAKRKVQLIDLPYNQLLNNLKSGGIDVAVWNVDEIIEHKLDFSYYPLNSKEYQGLDNEAVIVVKRKNQGIANLLTNAIDRESVILYQEQVMNGELIPNY